MLNAIFFTSDRATVRIMSTSTGYGVLCHTWYPSTVLECSTWACFKRCATAMQSWLDGSSTVT